MNNSNMMKGTLWKFLERLGVFGTQFIIQIILARLLSPSDYGELTLLMVFVTISNVLVQSGFNTALVQMKDITEKDYSSVLWISTLFASVIYALIYFMAPLIAEVYEMPSNIWPLRILGLILFPGAYYSILLAKVSRELDFKKVFYSNVFGAIISGTIGIIIALNGGGLWSLVFQQLINMTVCCVVLRLKVSIKIRFIVEIDRIKKFLSYGWKLIVSGLLNTLSEQLNSILIGYKFDAELLGCYTRGMQFPQYGISIIQDTMTGVLLPSISKVQEERQEVKKIMRGAMVLATYIVFPIMGGLAVISPELIEVLLTDKWKGCVPYLCIFCGVFALYPIHVCNLQVYNALGRSDLFLKIEVIKKLYSIGLLVLTVMVFDTPLSVAICTLLISPIGWFVNSYPNKKLIEYGFFEQVKDIMPNFLNTIIMLLAVYPIGKVSLPLIPMICIKVVIGVFIYGVLSIVEKNKNFFVLISILRNLKVDSKE